MRNSFFALVCVALVSCASESTTPSGDAAVPAAPLPMGAVCSDSSQCVSEQCVVVSATRAVCSTSCADRAACPAGESWDCVQPPGAAASVCACTSNSGTEICGDGRDNDCDGVTDCTTDVMDSSVPDATMPQPDASQTDASMCPTGNCEPEPTCATDPGLCPLCEENSDCDDGKFCTEDICRAGGCVHVSRDNGCEAAEICDPRDAEGCVAARACANDGDCSDEDACTQFEYCDTTAAVCRYQILDADRDQHLPMVCGGDDCNDNDERSYPGALDVCDNRDNNCDGMIDPPSAALLCAEGRMCSVGVCGCEPGLQECQASCVNPASFQTDANNCGACGTRCGLGRVCSAGLCEDVDECETIDDLCPAHSSCTNYDPGYDCPCDDGWEAVGGECVDDNECTANTDNCDSNPPACMNTTGGFECLCPNGYTGTGVGADGCDDIDECTTPNRCPGLNTECMNTVGSYECGCEGGFSADGGVCMDIEECELQIDECDNSPHECTDGVGGYTCDCPDTHIKIGDGHGVVGCASRVIALASGGSGSHACAILTGGRVQCWGENGTGQLGVGSAISQGAGAADLVDLDDIVNLGTGRTAKAVAIGGAHTCAILDNDSVKCWGYNVSGQLGLGVTTTRGDSLSELGDNLLAVSLGTGRTAKAIANGGTHSCAILDDNTLKCWGENGSGQLGRDNVTDRGGAASQMGDSLAIINLGAGRTAKKVTAGESHTCAILDDDSVKCWGSNQYGQLGDGTLTNKGDGAGEMAALQPVNLGTALTAKAISAGPYHTCAILNTDAVKCWGFGSSGELGVDTTQTRGDGAGEMGDALPIVLLGAGRTAKAIATGNQHTCALLDNDTLKCWGNNEWGQLGLGTNVAVGGTAGSMATLTGISLGTGLTPIAVRAGDLFTCALLDNERVKCWGRAEAGSLGQGTLTTRGDEAGEMGAALLFTRLGG